MYIYLLLLISGALALSPSSYLNSKDRNHLRIVLEPSWALSDLQQVFYSSGGFYHLGLPIPNKENVCTFAKNAAKADVSLESLYYISAIKKYADCAPPQPSSAKQQILDNINENAASQELYYAVLSASNFGIQIDNAKAMRAAQQILKKDDSILSLGYLFHVGSLLKGDLTAIFERIEDAIVQADEIDGSMLQFEGGLSITALVISGAYKLSEAAKVPVPLKSDQVIKFSNYLMSRKTVQIPKGVYYLLEAVTLLTNNKYHIPVAVTLESNVAVSFDSPKVLVKVTNLMGDDLGSLKVTASSAVEKSTKMELLKNKQLTKVQKEKSLYEMDIMSYKPNRGFYQLTLNAESSDSRLLGNMGSILTFKVLSSVKLQDVEIGTGDSDHSTAPNLKRITFPAKLDTVIEADQHQRVIMKFSILDEMSSKPTNLHQVFVRMNHYRSQKEIIFVIEADSANIYKFDMDVNARKKEFSSINGKYSVDLIVGDPSISNPVVWNVADAVLSFPDGINKESSEDATYKVKPDIKHLFRSPDPRPTQFVSYLFTGLCLVPILVLIIGWFRVGANFSNFNCSLSTLGFFLGLSSIFGLYYMFWLKFNMFATLKYLVLVGLLTFFSGNFMLAYLAEKRKAIEVKMVYGSSYNKAYRFANQQK